MNHKHIGGLVTVAMLVGLATLAGCGDRKMGEVPADPELPKGTVVINTPGGRVSHIVPTVLEDGTRCVALITNSNQGGISCDFPKVK